MEPKVHDAAKRTDVCYRRYAKNVSELLRFWKGFLTAEIGVFYSVSKRRVFGTIPNGHPTLPPLRN